MHKTIWKYKIDLRKPNEFNWPINSVVRKFDQQDGVLCIWVEHPIDESKNLAEIVLMKRRFHVFGTGHNILGRTSYIDSCFDGPFVWHLYEVG